MELSGKTVYGSVLKTTQLSAHAQNHASPERCRKSFNVIFLLNPPLKDSRVKLG